MGKETKGKGYLTLYEGNWHVNRNGHLTQVLPEDAMLCCREDEGSPVEFETSFDELGNEYVKIVSNEHKALSWDEIEEWYLSDNYPAFGGPFTDAMTPFQWLRIYFNPPRTK